MMSLQGFVATTSGGCSQISVHTVFEVSTSLLNSPTAAISLHSLTNKASPDTKSRSVPIRQTRYAGRTCHPSKENVTLMSPKNNHFTLSPHSAQSAASPDTPTQQADQTNSGSRDGYLFQPPITNNRPRQPGDFHDAPKRLSCEYCRRRKVKCDRREPCGQCSISFQDCVYAERSKRATKKMKSSSRQNAAKKLKMRDDHDSCPSAPVDITATATTTTSSLPQIESTQQHLQSSPSNATTGKTDTEEMGKCATAHHFIEQGEIEFHGTSAERTFMEELMDKIGDSSVTHPRIPVHASVPGLFHSDARHSDDVPLPARDQAMRLVEAALDAQVLLHIIHRPSFDFSFHMIYSLEPSEYSLKERRFLPLLYAVIAFGSLFIDPYGHRLGYDEVITRASRYFIKSKQLQDIASCNDLVSLQAIVFKNLFLLYTTRAPMCYTYLCTSMSVALRMGLHRSFHNTQDILSREISKRVFLALKLLSLEVSTCVGLPILVNDEDSDQELPLEVNDAYIQRGRVAKQPPNEICYASGSICYFRLQNILYRVLKDVYPRKGRASRGSVNYVVKVDTIRGIEQDLEKWVKEIPAGYRLGTYYEDRAVQRPFLHYDIETSNSTQGQKSTGRSPFASACIQACQNIIDLCQDICRWGLMTEAVWPTIRTLTSCMLTLYYIAIMHQDPDEEDMIYKALSTGRKLLQVMEKRSHQARRNIITSSLSIKFDHVREKLMKYELEAPNIRQGDLSSVSKEYTALLGERIFALSSKRYLRSCSFNPHFQNGSPNKTNHSSQPNILHRDLKEANAQQPQLSPDQTAQGNVPLIPTPASTIITTSPKGEDSPATGLVATSDAPGSFIPSALRPMQGNFLMAGPTTELPQDGPNGSWMNAFGSATSSGLMYSPMRDLLGNISPNLDDMNDLSDLWGWF
ncbi:Activator of stress protein [Trichoderma ghanense]|uniref:Activator of stress protein n=1 Tax=Trichoderma ghanense TaxID=65468 RepID=A0ABY2H248_9HYPO